MLKDNLYTITESVHDENIIKATIKLNRDHEIFCGHFPGQPVLPGVCMVQIIKEVLEGTLHFPLMLKKAATIKFLKPVTPEDKTLQVTLAYNSPDKASYNVTADLISENDLCFKFRGIFAV